MESRSDYILNKLKENCVNGNPTQMRLNSVLAQRQEAYTPEQVQFLERFLVNGVSDITRIFVLRILCKFGNPISKYIGFVKDFSSKFDNEIIKIAESQNDPETILQIASEERANVNSVVIALKRMNKVEYLTSFLFSENEDLSNLIRDMEDR